MGNRTLELSSKMSIVAKRINNISFVMLVMLFIDVWAGSVFTSGVLVAVCTINVFVIPAILRFDNFLFHDNEFFYLTHALENAKVLDNANKGLKEIVESRMFTLTVFLLSIVYALRHLSFTTAIVPYILLTILVIYSLVIPQRVLCGMHFVENEHYITLMRKEKFIHKWYLEPKGDVINGEPSSDVKPE